MQEGSYLSKLFRAYKDSLDTSYNEITIKLNQQKDKIQVFYNEFLKNLILNYQESYDDTSKLIRDLRRLFGKDEINFVAIDGSSFKEEFQEFLVFYGGAYSVKGSLNFKRGEFKLEYSKWETRNEKSIVAYLPIPYIEMDLEKEEYMFFSSDNEKVVFYNTHNQLMQLAEIYLAYLFAKENSAIDVILLDNSLSSMYLTSDILYLLERDGLNIVGYQSNRGRITPADILIAYSKPYNETLDIPNCKNFRGEFFVLRYLEKEGTLNKKFLFFKFPKLPCNKIKREKHISRLQKFKVLNDDLSINREIKSVEDSWNFTKALFESIGRKIFEEKDISALKNGAKWLNSNDLKFLISVGLRMLIEEAWKNNKLVIGIAKDSASKYFFKNYLGVMWFLGEYKFNPPGLTLSDRAILEILPFIDENLKAPWSTIEFDSVFMSLHLEEDNGRPYIAGFRGDVILPLEKLFLRSLAQFYVYRAGNKTLTGNVIFIDRIANPQYDKDYVYSKIIRTDRGDEIKPIVYRDNSENNLIQRITMVILNLLTKNLYPHVIGYPDPLHKADWGAKGIARKIRELIRSSEVKFISEPLKKSLRTRREEGYKNY